MGIGGSIYLSSVFITSPELRILETVFYKNFRVN